MGLFWSFAHSHVGVDAVYFRSNVQYHQAGRRQPKRNPKKTHIRNDRRVLPATSRYRYRKWSSCDHWSIVERNNVNVSSQFSNVQCFKNAIDLDQKGIKDQLSLETVEGYQAAERIYLEGAFISSIARLNLTLPLSENLELGDKVIGTSPNAASEVEGTLIDGLEKGSRVIKVKYDISRDQDNFSKCQVAANPTPNFDGCKLFYLPRSHKGRLLSYKTTILLEIIGFADDGLLVISGVSKSLSYSYDPLVDNYSDQSLARLSTDASDMMETCNEGCPYVDFKKFRDYYGTGDYAHRWIMAAFDGNTTEFSNGNADFGSYGTEGRYGKNDELNEVEAFYWT